MRVTSLKDMWILLTPVFFALFMFFIPISPTGKSIFFGCSIISIFLIPDCRRHLFYAYNTLWARAALGLFTYILISCLWSDAPYAMQWSVVEKYGKLIYLPILAVGFISPRTRTLGINSYLFAIFITCIISILKSNGIMHTGDQGEVFYNHIITGFMVAFGAYLSTLFAFRYKGWVRNIYMLMALLTSYQVLFINTGRTGYVIYFILMALLFIQKLSFKHAALGIVLFSGVMALVYHDSTIMQIRIHDLMSDVKFLHENNPNTSLGYRIQFHDYAKSLFEKHPVIGIGTGGFKYSFIQDNPVPTWGPELTDPHSQYWLTLSEHGLIGLTLLFIFLGSLFLTSFKLKETRPILLGILITFCIGSISDTILCYSTAGYILIAMSALSFGELIEKRAATKVSKSELSPLNPNEPINVIHA